MTTSAGVTYTFDGNFERVMDTSPKLYWYGLDGSVLAETDGSGNPVNEYIYFDGMRMARRDSGGNVYYSFGNELGSPTITTATGSICYDADFYPFGGERAYTSTCAPNQKFAGMEQDSATGLYRTIFRQYASNNGRWLSPDPYAGSYDPTNPQSMNRYAYVGNNPMNYIDPLGLHWECSSVSMEGGGWTFTNCTWVPDGPTTVTVTASADGCSDTNQSACAPTQNGNGPNDPSNGGYGGSGGGGGGAPNAILRVPGKEDFLFSSFCGQLYLGHQTFSAASEHDLERAGATFFSIGPPEVFSGASAAEGITAAVEGVTFSVFCK